MKRSSNGIALISTLMFLTILLIATVSLILVSRQQVFVGQTQHQKSLALYLAEAALAKSQVELESDPAWTGTTNASIDGIPGTYDITFGPGAEDSVNNLGSDSELPSQHPPFTIPSNSAYLIVHSQVMGHHYTLAALIRGDGAQLTVNDAILASGKVQSKGDLFVDGLASLTDSDREVLGSIQSNLDASGVTVSWAPSSPSAPDTVKITGSVGTGADTIAAIDIPLASIGSGKQSETTATMPAFDNIPSTVSGKIGAPAPVFETTGVTRLAPGDYYIDSTSTIVNGDIVLENGAKLFVKGDLEINGSLSGSGAVYVTGSTNLKGDASVTTREESKVALYSQGSVSLTGFDGSQFLADLASPDTDFQDLLAAISLELDGVRQGIKDFNPSAPVGSERNKVDQHSIKLGVHAASPGDGKLLNKVRKKLANSSEPLSPALTFLRKRLKKLDEMFSSPDQIADENGNPVGPPLFQSDAFDNFTGKGDTAGIFDAVMDGTTSTEERIEAWPAMINLMGQVNYDRIGTSYFQGTVYTNGAFYADNEVNILGALIVDGRGSASQTFGTGDEAVSLSPGDVYLGNRSRITYVESFFQEDPSNISGRQDLAVGTWMGR